MPKTKKAYPTVDATKIDLMAMPGALAFRLRDHPEETIFVFSDLDLAEKFALEVQRMTKMARDLAAGGPVILPTDSTALLQ